MSTRRDLALLLALTVAYVSFLTLPVSAKAQSTPQFKDFTTPTPLQGRIILFDPNGKAVWLNLSALDEKPTSGKWWFPGVNLKFYPENDAVWETLKHLGSCCPPPGEEDKIPSAEEAPLVEVVAQERGKGQLIIKSVRQVATRTDAPLIPLPPDQKVIRESSPNEEKLIVERGNLKRSLTITQKLSGYTLFYSWTSPNGESNQKMIQLQQPLDLREKIQKFLSKDFILHVEESFQDEKS